MIYYRCGAGTPPSPVPNRAVCPLDCLVSIARRRQRGAGYRHSEHGGRGRPTWPALCYWFGNGRPGNKFRRCGSPSPPGPPQVMAQSGEITASALFRRPRRDEPKGPPARRQNSRPIVGTIGRVYRGHIAVRHAVPGPLRPPLQYAVSSFLLIDVCMPGPALRNQYHYKGVEENGVSWSQSVLARHLSVTTTSVASLRPSFLSAVSHFLLSNLARHPPLLR